MLFPIGDTNVQGGYKPLFSYTFIVINVIVFAIQLYFTAQGSLVCEFGSIPNDIIGGDKLYTLLTSMFMHGGWMHLIGNMMFLWVFADNLEAVLGNVRFFMFYILGGIVASGVHIFFEMWLGDSTIGICCQPCLASMDCVDIETACLGSIPTLGASGAISAVLGAYMVMFPRSRIKVFFFVTVFTVPALIFLGLWFLEQLIAGVGALSHLGAAGGIAWWAHIGGFVFGLIYGFLNRNVVDESVYPT